MADALGEVAVAADDEGVVVADVGTEACAQVALGDGHADCIGETLAEGAGRDLDARRAPDLWMAGCGGTPLPELAQVLEGQAVAREVQHRVEEDRRVSGREDEALAVGPLRIGGVIGEYPGPQDMGQWSQRHGGPLVAGPGGVGAVHREAADDVDGPGFEGSVQGGAHWRCGSGRGRDRSPYTRGPDW